jgi:NAD(P)-dependent dehydrogenase (short-subunit alcohol dehydrogenase family)
MSPRVVIAGAGRGVGRAAAENLAVRGARIHAFDISEATFVAFLEINFPVKQRRTHKV